MHPPPLPRAVRRERPAARTAAALLASALLNALALCALARAAAFRLPQRRATTVALARVDAAEWEARRGIAEPGPTATIRGAEPLTRAAPARRSGEIPSGHVVRVAPSQDPRRPERARFLAERDNTVARETQWRGAAVRNLPLAARPAAGAADGQGIPLPGEEGSADASSPGREGTAGAEAAARITLARRVLAPGQGDVVASVTRSSAGGGEDGARRAGRFDPRILPLGDAYGSPGRGAPSGERLPGVADGDATLVNTRAFRFAEFYRRVAEAIRGEWDPNRVWDARDPQDQLLGRQRRKVLVDIVLDPEGRLRDTRLVRGTGLDFFDRECLRAIAAAAPFPNPPRALVGADGLVVLREWALAFEWAPDTVLDRLLPRR